MGWLLCFVLGPVNFFNSITSSVLKILSFADKNNFISFFPACGSFLPFFLSACGQNSQCAAKWEGSAQVSPARSRPRQRSWQPCPQRDASCGVAEDACVDRIRETDFHGFFAENLDCEWTLNFVKSFFCLC